MDLSTSPKPIASTSHLPPKSRQACLPCRASKIRCKEIENSLDTKCVRCFERGFICIYKANEKRGRKIMYGITSHCHPSNCEPNTSTSPNRIIDSTVITTTNNTNNTENDEMFRVLGTNAAEHSTAPKEFTSLASILNETSVEVNVKSRSIHHYDNPVELNLLTRGNVVDLFDNYFEHLNPLIALLDPLLHTPDYTSQSSTILLTAIVTVAAKMFAPSLYSPLLALSNRLLGEAFANGLSTIGLVQALSLLVFWKDPHDDSAWRRIGYAIRLGYELSLDDHFKRPLPDDELESREMLNGERTWIQLSCFDLTLQRQQSRPRMIQSDTVAAYVTEWAYDHPKFSCTADFMLAASLSKDRPLLVFEATLKLPVDIPSRHQLRDERHKAFMIWEAQWLNSSRPSPLHPVSLIVVKFYDLFMHYLFSSFDYDTLLLTPNISLLEQYEGFCEHSRCAVTIINYVSSSFGRVLLYSQDVVFFGVVNAVLFLVKNLGRMNSEGVKVVLNSLVSLILSCEQAARFPSDSCGILSRFIQSLLVGVEQPELSATSHPHPSNNGTNNSNTTSNGNDNNRLTVMVEREESVLDKFNWEPLPVVHEAQTFSENFAEYSDWFQNFVAEGNFETDLEGLFV